MIEETLNGSEFHIEAYKTHDGKIAFGVFEYRDGEKYQGTASYLTIEAARRLAVMILEYCDVIEGK